MENHKRYIVTSRLGKGLHPDRARMLNVANPFGALSPLSASPFAAAGFGNLVSGTGGYVPPEVAAVIAAARAAAASTQPKIDLKEIKTTSRGRRVVTMAADQSFAMAAANPDLVVEEDHPLKLLGMPGIPPVAPNGNNGNKFTLTVTVTDGATGKPIPKVTLFALGSSGAASKADGDDSGNITLQTSDPVITKLIVSPYDTYWSRVVSDIPLASTKTLAVSLDRLTIRNTYDWGQQLMGFPQANTRWRGKGIKIGLIDTGVWRDHKNLHPNGGLNTLEGDTEKPDGWFNDGEGHGTHCAGVISAAINGASPDFSGIIGGAPEAEVYAVRVFPGGFVSDLVQAVEWCVTNKMDVISMSLGMPDPSPALASALQEAYAAGITCIAATGNDRTHVSYPAALDSVMGVGAMGMFGTFPADSGHTLKVGKSVNGPIFAADFSNFGEGVDFCAPGVAILSTVPKTGHAAWDGTSMACPMVAALIALVIEAYPQIRTGTSQTPDAVKALLQASAVDLGLPPAIQGKGLPIAARALAQGAGAS